MSIAAGQVIASADVLVGMTASGRVKFGSTAQSGTIAAGVLTATQNVIGIAPESGTQDNLDTIASSVAGVADVDGALLLVYSATAGAEIAIKHATGNIRTPAQRDVVLRGSVGTGDQEWALLVRVSSVWYVVATNALSSEQSLFNFNNFS